MKTLNKNSLKMNSSRTINVLRADGTWGTPGVYVDNLDTKEYLAPMPKGELEAEEIRELIAEDFPERAISKRGADSRRRSFNVSVYRLSEDLREKELLFRHRKASDLQVFTDGTWVYDTVESEDVNHKYFN